MAYKHWEDYGFGSSLQGDFTLNCSEVSINENIDHMDVTASSGATVASVPVKSYTVTCSDVQNLETAYDVIKNLGATLRFNVDGSVTIAESMNVEPKKPEKPKEEKEKEDMQRVTIPMPTRMLRNGRATIVFFSDNTRIVVKLPDGVEDNEYNAFCAAITKKMFGTNTRIKSKMEEIREVVPTEAEKRAAIKQKKAEAVQKQQAEIDKKVRRMAHQMVLEKQAKKLAKEMMEGDA